MTKLQLFPDPGLINRVPLTKLRPHLSEVVDLLTCQRHKFLITRHGHTIGAIVPVQDFWRIWEDEELDLYGPKDPKTGKRPGAVWVKQTGWQRHLHVDWTENGPVVDKKHLAEFPAEEEEEEVSEEKAPERRTWWRFW